LKLSGKKEGALRAVTSLATPIETNQVSKFRANSGGISKGHNELISLNCYQPKQVYLRGEDTLHCERVMLAAVLRFWGMPRAGTPV